MFLLPHNIDSATMHDDGKTLLEERRCDLDTGTIFSHVGVHDSQNTSITRIHDPILNLKHGLREWEMGTKIRFAFYFLKAQAIPLSTSIDLKSKSELFLVPSLLIYSDVSRTLPIYLSGRISVRPALLLA